MTEEQRYREKIQLKKDEIQVLKKIADTLVDIRVRLDSTLTPNELRELCGMKPIPQSIDAERPCDILARKITGKRAEASPVDDYIGDGLDTLAEIIMDNMKQE